MESSFTVTSAYTAEDFVSDTRSAFLACVTEDFGEQVASEAASLVDGQIASMSWYRRFEIWSDLASYDICGVANADHLIDGLEEESYLCLPDVLIDIIETGASGNRSSFLI